MIASILTFAIPFNDLAKKHKRLFENYQNQLIINEQHPDFKKYLDFFVTRILDLENFKELYIRYSLPAAKNAVSDFKKIGRRHKIQNEEFITKEFIENSLQEQFKLGYIGLNHKREQFTKDLIVILGYKKKQDKSNFLKFCQENYNLDITEGENRPESLKEIQWLCNQSKHSGTFLIKNEFTPLKYLLNSELILNEIDFVEHVDFMRDYFLKM